MGTLVIHAGMPKTGSTSLQRWLADEHRRLRRDHDVRVVVGWPLKPPGLRTRVALAPPAVRPADSSRLAELLARDGPDARAATEGLFEQLDASAERAGVTVISSEALAGRFVWGDERFLAGLAGLARRHEVRVAYYVRPQHTALEAAWRQWGFRGGSRPSRFVVDRSDRFHYFDTLTRVRALAPGVGFEPRPCRPDLLPGGTVVEDFARRFLGLGEGAGEAECGRTRWSNRGLPLEVVNALRAGPEGALWASRHDNRRIRAVKRLVAGVELPETAAIRRSRLVLRGYAHRTFEEGNRRLISEFGWPTDAFVAPVEEDVPEAELELRSLDGLWAPAASAAELAILRAAVDQASSMRGSLRILAAQLRGDE